MEERTGGNIMLLEYNDKKRMSLSEMTNFLNFFKFKTRKEKLIIFKKLIKNNLSGDISEAFQYLLTDFSDYEKILSNSDIEELFRYMCTIYPYKHPNTITVSQLHSIFENNKIYDSVIDIVDPEKYIERLGKMILVDAYTVDKYLQLYLEYLSKYKRYEEVKKTLIRQVSNQCIIALVENDHKHLKTLVSILEEQHSFFADGDMESLKNKLNCDFTIILSRYNRIDFMMDKKLTYLDLVSYCNNIPETIKNEMIMEELI